MEQDNLSPATPATPAAAEDAAPGIVMQPYGQLAAHDVIGCLLVVQLRDAPSKCERRKFFNRMRRAMRSQGIAMSQRYGLCFLVPVERTASATDRHVAVDWLVDQPQTRVVLINRIRPVVNFFSKPLDIVFEDEEPATPEYRVGAERFVRCLVAWALIERVHALRAMAQLPIVSEIEVPESTPQPAQSQDPSNPSNLPNTQED